MEKFNHLENLCGFLDAASKFESILFDDDDFKYDEEVGRNVFAEHIFNLLVEHGADVDEAVARRITDILAPAFYHVNEEHYRESNALQGMLRAADAEVERQIERMNAGDYRCSTFTITIGCTSSTFMLGGPQFDALYAFAHHIACENGYEINMNSSPVTVKE